MSNRILAVVAMVALITIGAPLTALGADSPLPTVVGYEDVDLAGNPFVNFGGSVDSGGFNFSSAGSIFIIGAPNLCVGQCADNGSQTLVSLDADGIPIGTSGGPITITEQSGSLFTIERLDVAEGIAFNPQLPHAETITIVGTLADGTKVSESFTLDGVIDSTGPLQDFETFNTSVLVNTPVISATISASGQSDIRDGGFSLDNIVLGKLEPQLINDFLAIVDGPKTVYDPDDPRAPAGVYTLTATFQNTSNPTSFFDLFFEVVVLEPGDKNVLNCDGGPEGVGCKVSIPAQALGRDGILEPGETFTVQFEIGLDVREQFTFFANALGIPMPPP